jgi:hypothetical protein
MRSLLISIFSIGFRSICLLKIIDDILHHSFKATLAVFLTFTLTLDLSLYPCNIWAGFNRIICAMVVIGLILENSPTFDCGDRLSKRVAIYVLAIVAQVVVAFTVVGCSWFFKLVLVIFFLPHLSFFMVLLVASLPIKRWLPRLGGEISDWGIYMAVKHFIDKLRMHFI